MKALGIVRRIDQLGRIVIPKELRRAMDIDSGDAVEIFAENNGDIVLRKYEFTNRLVAHAKNIADSLSNIIGMRVVVCDEISIIADSCEKSVKKNYISANIKKSILLAKGAKRASDNIEIDNTTQNVSCVAPIRKNDETVGAILTISENKKVLDDLVLLNVSLTVTLTEQIILA